MKPDHKKKRHTILRLQPDVKKEKENIEMKPDEKQGDDQDPVEQLTAQRGHDTDSPFQNCQTKLGIDADKESKK